MLSHSNQNQWWVSSLLLVLILLLIWLSYTYWTSTPEITLKIGSYVQLLTVFIMSITVIIALLSFKNQTDDRNRSLSIQYTNLTRDEINDIEKQFMNNPHLDRLYFEMYSHSPNVKKIKNLSGDIQETKEMLKQEQHMASIIFQKIADIYFCEQLSQGQTPNTVEWINTFRIWLKSHILRSHWTYMKYEHHPEVRNFIETLG